VLGLYVYVFFVLVFRPGVDAVWRQKCYKEVNALCATCDTNPAASGISLTYLMSGLDYDCSSWSSYFHFILRHNSGNSLIWKYEWQQVLVRWSIRKVLLCVLATLSLLTVGLFDVCNLLTGLSVAPHRYIHLVLRGRTRDCLNKRYQWLTGTCTLIGANQVYRQWWWYARSLP
jgi:hypothetical protein